MSENWIYRSDFAQGFSNAITQVLARPLFLRTYCFFNQSFFHCQHGGSACVCIFIKNNALSKALVPRKRPKITMFSNSDFLLKSPPFLKLFLSSFYLHLVTFRSLSFFFVRSQAYFSAFYARFNQFLIILSLPESTLFSPKLIFSSIQSILGPSWPIRRPF